MRRSSPTSTPTNLAAGTVPPAGGLTFVEAPRFQQRPEAINCNGSGGWFCARENGWTSYADHVHRTPEEASRCWAEATR